MGDLTQPQQKYDGTGENRNIAIPVIFYPVMCKSRKQFCKQLKIVKKSRNF